MFVRKKQNISGSVSIQIIDKSHGYRVVETIGSARDPDDVERLVQEGRGILRDNHGAQQKLFSIKTREDYAIEIFLKELKNAQIRTIGPELIFGALFDRIGFNAITDELFRHIVIARLAYPTSKLKTVDYLYRYKGIRVHVQTVYRFLDTLHRRYKEQAERIAYAYTQRILGTVAVVFYDMTTLYFESDDEDNFRKIGYSKDGKFQHPQIMLGLLVGRDGYPIGDDIFEGNTFEGHTLIPTLEKIQKKYGFKKPIVVADAALLSKDNLKKLGEAKYRFIIGARIKNETDAIKTDILTRAQGIKDGENFVINKPDGTKLVVTSSDKRARRDAYNRERGLRKLRLRVKSGRLTKEHITNRGYNKFLTLEGKVAVAIDESKITQDSQWDGLKGYVTNADIPAEEVVEQYGHLWHIEKAFRISKTDLRVRPIFHRLKKRIEAHLCIAFVAYAIYKELERLLVERGMKFSPKRASELTHNMYALEYILPNSVRTEKVTLKMDSEQQIIYDIIHK